MAQDSATNQMPALAEVALRYPEKTFYLGQVFKDTTNSYKLFWFLAILSLLKRSEERSFRLADILTEMARHLASGLPLPALARSAGQASGRDSGVPEGVRLAAERSP
jgi:hypothetical protein